MFYHLVHCYRYIWEWINSLGKIKRIINKVLLWRWEGCRLMASALNAGSNGLGSRSGTLGICGVAVLRIFSCGVAVKKIPACGVAVISSLTVCDVCILESKRIYLRYSRFHNFWTNDLPETFLYRRQAAVTFQPNFAVIFIDFPVEKFKRKRSKDISRVTTVLAL